MTKNSKLFKVQTIEQYKILQYINEKFHDNTLELELIEKGAIKATDYKGEQIVFYLEDGVVKCRDVEEFSNNFTIITQEEQ